MSCEPEAGFRDHVKFDAKDNRNKIVKYSMLSLVCYCASIPSTVVFIEKWECEATY
jgi:hypothetical protein